MSRKALVDAGPLIALLIERDEHHEVCTELMQSLVAPALTCWPVIAEAAWLVGRHNPRAVTTLLAMIESNALALLPLDVGAVRPVADYLRQYDSIGAQLADACLLHLAEREGINTIFTLDRRDFTVYRLRNRRRLRLIPDLDSAR